MKKLSKIKLSLYYKYIINSLFFNKQQVLYNIIFNIICIGYKYIEQIKLENSELILILSNFMDINILLLLLQKHYKFQYKELIDICTIDYYQNPKSSRFELNYLLLSIKYKLRLRVQFYCSETKIAIPSISQLYLSALWLERENWDMFGIFFSNHIDLRRILTDYGFEGFPLRKDFPLTGYIELKYNMEEKIVKYELVKLDQNFRFFEFINPWTWK